MDVEIGSAAGDVYRYLEAHGPTSVSQLKKGTGHADSTINLALGWLAREDKVAREAKGRAIRWTVAKC